MLARIFLETATRMKFLAPLLLLASSLHAAMLPGFRVESVADVPGLVTSIAIDSKGTIYCTNTSGFIYRVVGGGQTTVVTSLPTHEGGNGGLLGMSLIDDHTAAVHYTTWSGERVLDDIVSVVDLATGGETVLHDFVCDIQIRERGASDEHHGGNPTVAPDGSIFVGIGEYNDFLLAQKPDWNGGKIFRIDADGHATQFAKGLRNPFDLAWDPDLERIVVTDNGPSAGDELHILAEGSNAGWPETVGKTPQVGDSVAPDYVFEKTVAPTGMLRLARDANAQLKRGGYLVGSFVTRALYYFPDLQAKPIRDPIPIIDAFNEFVMDAAQMPNGDVYIATGRFPPASRIYRLVAPLKGDCDGDGVSDSRDVPALMQELQDGDPHPTITAQDGAYRGSWGCDANADSRIDSADLSVLMRKPGRRRSARSP